MLPKLERRPDLALLAQGGLHFVATALVLALGIGLGFHYDQPRTRTEYEVLDLPPACLDIEAALQTERARLATLDDATANAAALAAGLPDVVLTRDTDQITEHAEAVDDANRKVQAARLQLATDQATTNTAVSKCAPERDR